MKKKRWWHYHAPKAVSAKDAETWLNALSEQQRDDAIAELTQFGTLLLGEMTSRSAALDSKATSILGFSAVPLGALLVGTPEWIDTTSWGVVLLALIGIGSAITSAGCAIQSLRTRDWHWPSQPDWIRQDLLDKLPTLRHFHLLSMLETYQTHELLNATKAAWLVRAQQTLLLATVIVAGMAVYRILDRFIRSLI